MTYNYAKLPATVIANAKNYTYIYSADRRKLKMSDGTTTYTYLGGAVFKNNEVEFMATPEGRWLPKAKLAVYDNLGKPQTNAVAKFDRYEYQLKDHLGDLRVACRCLETPNATKPENALLNINVQENQSCATPVRPWGADLNTLALTTAQTSFYTDLANQNDRFTYNGKEKQGDLGYFDYGARLYDPLNGRWNAVDPLAELEFGQGGYNYVGNNPLVFIDPTGMKRHRNKEGFEYDDEDTEPGIYAERNTFNAAFGFDLMYQAHACNKKLYGEASPYRKYFQEGGAVAAAVPLVPLAIIGAAEAGAGAAIARGASYLKNVDYAALGRLALRTARTQLLHEKLSLGKIATRGVVNILSQAYSSNAKGDDFKLNITSLVGDMFLTNGAKSILNSSFKLEINAKGDLESKSYYGEDFVGRLAVYYSTGALSQKYNDTVKPYLSEAMNIYSQVVTKILTGETRSKLIDFRDGK